MKTYRFNARIENAGGGGAYILFPYDVEKEFGTKGRIPVQATFDGVPYAGSLVKYSHPQHMIGILKGIREQIAKGPGDMVQVELRRDDSERIVPLPPEFAALLGKEKLLETFRKLSYTNQKEHVRWIGGAKRAETRAARLTRSVEMLRAGIKSPE